MTVRCPACGRRIALSYQTGRVSCPTCGWGTGRPASVPEGVRKRFRIGKRPVHVTNLTTVLLLWLAAGAIIAIADWVVFGLVKVEATDENLLFFAGGIVAYALVGYFMQPAADEEGSEWLFGGCWEDSNVEGERGSDRLRAALVLFPGRLIALAVVHTFCLIRQAVSGGGAPP